jgi:hypothetical protein
MLRNLAARLERLEAAYAPASALCVVPIYEGETESEALAAYEAKGGTIGPNDRVIGRTCYITRDRAPKCA